MRNTIFIKITVTAIQGICTNVNQFNPATMLCLSQPRTWISSTICCIFCVFQWSEVRGSCSFWFLMVSFIDWCFSSISVVSWHWSPSSLSSSSSSVISEQLTNKNIQLTSFQSCLVFIICCSRKSEVTNN